MRLSVQAKTNGVIAGVILLAVALAVVSVGTGPLADLRSLRGTDIGVLVAMLVFVVVVDLSHITLVQFKVDVTYTVSTTVYAAAAIGYGPIVGIVLAFWGTLLIQRFVQKDARKRVFNVAQNVVCTEITGLLYYLLSGGDAAVPLTSARLIGFALVASIAYLVVNATLVSLVVGVSIGRSPVSVFISLIPAMLLQNVTLPSIGLLLTSIRLFNPLAFFIVVLPLLGPWMVMRGYRETLQQVQRTIEVLADMVDRRDVTTAQHSARVAEYTQQIIDEIGGIKIAEAEAIILAARVHDLGKIAIPDSVLLKPGRLDEEEYRLMRSHPAVGDEVLHKLSIYKDSLGVVRHHHERYDGKGYPDGLKGEEIPFGARIVGVADTYDVITSDRPYHRVRSVREAKEELIACKGTQFDPDIVDAFIRVLDRVHGITPAPVPEAAEPLVPAAATR